MIKNNASKWWIFAVTSMANLCVCFAINSLNLALPTLVKEFGVSQGSVSWLALVYSLIPCCMLLICGKLADLYGYKRQYIIGFSIFGAASLAAPLLAYNLLTLIIFRVFQGFGYSLLISITQATISRTFDDSERGKVLGINSVFVSLGLASGPFIGGFLLTRFTWHAIYYFCVPLCVLGLIATLIVMPANPAKELPKKKLDWLGGSLFAAAVGTLAVGLNFSDDWGWISVPFATCISIFIIALCLFIWREKVAETPLVPLQLFRNKTFSLASATSALSYTTQQLTTYLFPFFLVNILMLRSDKSGMVLLASPIAMMIMSPLGGSLSDKFGTKKPAVAGLLLIALNCILVGFFKANMNIVWVILVLCMLGTGNGLSASAINSAILGSAPKEYSGVASGMLATMRNIGNTFGTAIGSVVLITRQAHYERAAGLGDSSAYLLAQRDAFLIGLVLVFSAIMLVIQIPNRKKT